MNIIIKYTVNTPIYRQIYDQILSEILSGNLQQNAPLPSMRTLAKDLQVSIITTKKAYELLEQNSYIVTVPGKGCYVNIDRKCLVAKIKNDINIKISEIITMAKNSNMDKTELIKIFTERTEKEL